MKQEKKGKRKTRRSARVSVTFPLELYSTLEDLAKRKKVSLAWVVREGAEKYVADQWPLFAKSEHDSRSTTRVGKGRRAR